MRPDHGWYPKTELPNRLRVISAPMPQMESVALGIWLAAGGRYETPRLAGISHFLEHLLFKGTATRTARQIKEAIEGLGGSMNAFTDSEFTALYAKVPAAHAGLALEVLMEMVRAPQWEPGEIERERQVILEEIRMYLDMPMQHVQDLLNALLWPGQPLGLALSGTERSVARISRPALRAYQQRFYTPANLVVAAAGPISHRLIVDQVRRAFGRVPPGRVQRFPRARQRQAAPRVQCLAKETEQTHAALGFHAFPRNHPHIHGLNLLHVILGGNMSSRLFHQVREVRGLAYDIGTHVKRYRDTGALMVSAGVEPRKFGRALRVVLRELARIRRQPVGRGEFERAREFYAGQMRLVLEDTVDHMLWIGENEMVLGRAASVAAVLDDVQRVRPSDVTRVARDVLRPSHLNLAVIGPLAPRDQRQVRRLVGG